MERYAAVRVGYIALVPLLLAGAQAASAFEVSSVNPGCVQQLAWCERAAAVSYGDPERFRSALGVIVSHEWTRYVASARAETPGVSTPDVAAIVDGMYKDWRLGNSCCNVTLSAPGSSSAREPDYSGMCRRGDDRVDGGAGVRACLEAVSSARTKNPAAETDP
jgi:hypothetical protein